MAYERYAAEGPTPPNPDAPSTSPDPAEMRLRATTKCLVVRDERACCIRFATVRDPDGGSSEGEGQSAVGDWSLPGGGVERNLALVVRCEERERRPVDTDANPADVEKIAAHEWVPLAAVGDRVVGDAIGEIIDRRLIDGAD